MGFAREMLWAKLGGRMLDTYWQMILRASGGGGGGGADEGGYGVEWDYSDPSPVLTRIGDAQGFADPMPATSLAGSGSSPFDSIMPWAGMKKYNIINGEVTYSQDDAEFSETAYDTVVYIPEFWYKAEKDTSNHKWRWSISPTERAGYEKHPGSGRYIGRYHSSGNASGVFSKSGVVPFYNASGADFRAYCHNKGTDWWMLDLATWSAVQILYLVEYANFDSQNKLGAGQNSGSVKAVGGTDGAVYHTIKLSSASNQYRWVEDPFSNVRNWVDGFVSTDYNVYVGLDNSVYDGTTTPLTQTGITLPSRGYISGLGYSEVCPFAFIPDTASDAAAGYYVTDYLYSKNTVNAGLLTGGTYASGSKPAYGMFFFCGDTTDTTTASMCGARLIFIPPEE